MTKVILVRFLSLIVVIAGVLVILGWIFDIQTLKSVLPQFVTMKLTTAFSFILSAIGLYMTTKNIKRGSNINGLVLIFVNFLLILIMTLLVISVFFGIKTGFEDLFISESPGTINTIVPGRPAIVSMINFIIIAIIGLSFLFNQLNMFRFRQLMSMVVVIIAIIAIVGYIIGNPILYYHTGGVSTAVALNTAILFVILGVGFFVSNNKNT